MSSVDARSVAENEGLLPGDHIVQVNGTKFDGLFLFSFFLLFDFKSRLSFSQLLAGVNLLYFHRGQPQHREIHTLLVSNSVWVL